MLKSGDQEMMWCLRELPGCKFHVCIEVAVHLSWLNEDMSKRCGSCFQLELGYTGTMCC